MPEYIEREALLKHAIALNNPHELGENVVPVSDIEAAPAVDVARVVRCGKCINRFNWNNGCGVCRMIGQNMNDTDFCSYGKRKDGESNDE